MTREEALKKVRQMSLPQETMEILEALAPELTESEDERIRKEIIEHIKDQIDSFISAPDCRDNYEEEELARYKRWITYLEKQKEQKPTEWSEEDEDTYNRVYRLFRDAIDEWYKAVFSGCYPKITRTKVLAMLKSLPMNLKKKNEDVAKLCSNEWSEEDRKILNTIISDGSRGVVFDAKQVNFLKSLCPQYRWKPSEQEKSALRTAIHILTDERSFPKAAVHLQNILDAFEDEEPRKDWKPTKEQMEALQIAATISKTDSNTLTSLLIDLKKL